MKVLEDWKIKVSLLWLLHVVGSLGYMIFGILARCTAAISLDGRSGRHEKGA